MKYKLSIETKKEISFVSNRGRQRQGAGRERRRMVLLIQRVVLPLMVPNLLILQFKIHKLLFCQLLVLQPGVCQLLTFPQSIYKAMVIIGKLPKLG